jgi:gamma-glutamyltranspeptidase / glutathione hydrolase
MKHIHTNNPVTPEPVTAARTGVIAAGDPETAAAGAAILKQGGNAVDAAVAAAFASFIAEIGVVHWGGSGLAHIYDGSSSRSLVGRGVVYDFFSDMPGRNGSPPAQLDFEEVTIDFGATTQSFHLGRASVAVPGNIFGLCQLAADYGRLPLSSLLQPALRLAREGLHLTRFQTDTCELLAPLYTHTPSMRHIFVKNGRLIRPDDHFYIPDLAGTLEALAEEGESLLRNGRLAQIIVHDQQTRGGLLTSDDLAQYQVHKVEPIRLPYREFEILLPPPCSSGGVLTAFTFKLLNRFDIRALRHGSADHLRLLYEVMVATTQARDAWESLSLAYPTAEAIARFLDDGFIRTYTGRVNEALARIRPTPPHAEPTGGSNTSHLSVVDGDGLAVSLTTTAGESAGYVVPGTGIILNNMLGEADLHPNGFHTRPAGKRIPTMMTPTIVLKNGQTRLVLGSGGSIRIRSAILQVLCNLLDFKMTLAEAVEAPRAHVEDGVLQCEAGFDETAVSQLADMGYPVNRWPRRSIYFGGVHSVSRDENGRLDAAGDNRRGGAIAMV